MPVAREQAEEAARRAKAQQQQKQQAKPNGAAGAPLAPLIGVPLEDLIKLKLPKRPRLLGPWFTKSSLVMVHARTGVGKTWFSLSAFQALAMGSTFLKWTADQPRRVLYIDGEMPGVMVQDRGRILLNGGTTNGNLIIVTPDLQTDPMPNLATEDGRARIEPLLNNIDALAINHITALIRHKAMVPRATDGSSRFSLGCSRNDTLGSPSYSIITAARVARSAAQACARIFST